MYMIVMQRTSLMLPEDLQRQAAELAREQGISLGELVRRSLVRETQVRYRVDADTFWDAPETFHSGQTDLAARHDDELYGPIRSPRPVR
jgi:hypothetical protein